MIAPMLPMLAWRIMVKSVCKWPQNPMKRNHIHNHLDQHCITKAVIIRDNSQEKTLVSKRLWNVDTFIPYKFHTGLSMLKRNFVVLLHWNGTGVIEADHRSRQLSLIDLRWRLKIYPSLKTESSWCQLYMSSLAAMGVVVTETSSTSNKIVVMITEFLV